MISVLRYPLSALLGFTLWCVLATAAQAAGDVVEIRLVDDVDEPRGYCLDIAGGRGPGAKVERGLQAHTCYDYSGTLLVDQAFDTPLLEQGTFRIPHFDVCMTAASSDVGAPLMLAPCEATDSQRFSLEPSGALILTADPTLCVTVSDSEKRSGRGGEPVHVMRPVSLQVCRAEASRFQTWSLFAL